MSEDYHLICPAAAEGISEMARGDIRTLRSGHPAHWHSEWQLVAVTRGDGWVKMGDATHRTISGSLFLVPPEVVHSNGVEEEGCSFRSMLLDPSLVHGIAREAGLRLGRTEIRKSPVWNSERLVQRFQSFHRHLEARPSCLETESFLEGLLTNLLSSRCGQSEKEVKVVAHPAARRARECLWSRADESISLSMLAREVGLSRFELVRQFKAAYGMPPHAWQLQVRISRAKALLKTGVTSGEVALQLGFSDQAHFTRVFRRSTGFPPARFQREFRNIIQDSLQRRSHDDA